MTVFKKISQHRVFNEGKFSCYLVGEDSMADRCVKVILEEGHDLLGICTPNDKLALFAEQNEIPCTNSLEIFESWMKENRCDFLFSVVNTRILREGIIKQPRQFCINFHNAPLPKYAGVHATPWAILNDEKTHGATWHVLEEGVDTGDILKQCIFKTGDRDTGFSLNVKCIENAMPLFHDLLKELTDGTYKRVQQDLNQRSYYTLHQKPKNFGVISWPSATAEEIYAMRRALDFSEYANNLCLPKFICDNTVFFAKRINISDKKSKAEPGTIVDISEKYLRIATLTNDITVSQITDIDNKSYEIADFVAAHGISEGKGLTSPDPVFLDKLRQHGEKLSESESYWVKTLERAESLNFLSLNTSRTKNDVVVKEKIVFSDKTFSEKVSSLLPEDASSETALITMFLLYLYRLNNYDDYSVGYKSSYAESIAEDIGDFFAEVVPINLTFSAEIDFIQAFSPVAKLLSTTKAKNTFSKDVNLRYPQLHDNTLSLPIVISTSEPTAGNSRCLCFVINSNTIKLYFPDDLDELNLKIAENMSGHLQVFISEILRDKTLRVKNVPLLTESEKHLLMEEYNDTAADYPRNSSIVEIFEEQVLKYPNNIAVKHENNCLTYDELNQKANQLVSHLTDLGVKKGSIVATYFNKGINSILSMLAVVKSGAAYTPIDPMYPKEYIKNIIKDTGTLVLLTQEKDRQNLEKSLPSGRFIILSIDDPDLEKKIFDNPDNKNASIKIESSDLVYVMYTSGSTGVPKGVMVPHRGVVRLVKNTNYIKFEPGDCVAQATSISFDPSTLEIWGALLNGATLVCADTDLTTDAERLGRFLHNEKATFLSLTPALFDQLVSVNNEMFGELKFLFIGGDVLNVESVHRILNCSEGCPSHVLNVYGPTENTVITSAFFVPKDFDRNRSIPIGKPIANTTVYVLDRHLNPMPVGIPGELCAGGDGLAVGYLNREDLTKEKFVKTVLNGKDARFYKIGDLVRWLSDGNLEYICRIDNQVKIRGFRIELDAIELCLLNSKLINQCAVIIQQDNRKRKTIVVFLVFKRKKDIPALRKFLSKYLPHYMVPNVFIAVNSLPQTPNGKVDKKELFSRFKENTYESVNYVAPRNELESKLADIWKDLLRLNIVGVTDNFFDVGGYSLLITEMTVRIKEQFNIELSLSSFLESPTIETLSRLIDPEDAESSCNSSVSSQFEKDIFLDPKIKPIADNASESRVDAQKSVLLTGATGFLGAYLLGDLYRLTKAKIYCLVRGKDIDDAKQRLGKTIEKYQLDNALIRDVDRVNVILGDLSKPNLGLDQSLFDKLAAEVHDIYHCGANVHHIYNYETLRKSNVLSTLEVVKLAVNKRNKHIHYISTLSVISGAHLEQDKLVKEDFITENNAKLEKLNGYAQTKLASEIILGKAHKRGISVSIYRPSWIIGSMKGKYYDLETNHLLLLLKGCVQMGYAPGLNTKMSVLPIDFVSSFIVKISLNSKINNLAVFNLVNPFYVSWNKLIQKLSLRGIKISSVSPVFWYKNYFSKVDGWNIAYPLMSLYSDGGVNWAKIQNILWKVDTSNTKSAAKMLNLTYDKVDDFLADTVLDFYNETVLSD
ncbi:MAG: amino acid adenylation domain-containing protein [Holosporaceae bacterium]|jgi:amino acid adenylation domain-containing protein/thioester reductase-like protein|nr:amino acid adenylation domain-containing protein [Holosporaceae bacterium]